MPTPRTARRLLVAVAAVIVVASLFPFVPDPPRLVRNGIVRDAEGALRFTPPSRAVTADPPAWLDEAAAADAVAVTLVARSDAAAQDGPARLFTVSRDYYAADLQVGQAAEDLVVRLRRPASDDGGDPWYEVEGVFADRGWRRIEVAVEPGRFTIRVDGALRMDEPLPADALAGWDPTMRLALGDEVVGERGWSGTLRQAEVSAGGQTVDYVAPGALVTPAAWWQLPERLRQPVQLDGWELVATTAHALAFVVLGALAVLARPRRGVAWVTGGAALFASVLLVAKVGMAARHPAVHDVVVQTAAAAVGAWWTRRWSSRAVATDRREEVAVR